MSEESGAEAGVGFRSTPVGEIKLSDASTLKVSTFEGRDGKKRVDIRVFLTGTRYTGPTKKGVSIPVDQLGELKSLLDRVSQTDSANV